MIGVTDGARTHDNRNHNPGLYQLSYGHHSCLYPGYELSRKATCCASNAATASNASGIIENQNWRARQDSNL